MSIIHLEAVGVDAVDMALDVADGYHPRKWYVEILLAELA